MELTRSPSKPTTFSDSASASRGDDLVVVALESGEIKSRIPTGSTLANGMFLSAGDNRDVYYCTTGSIARVYWE